MTKEMVKKPSHYEEGRKYAPIDVILDWDLNFNLGSALKYISRADRKDDTVQDLEKAIYYIQHQINSIKNETDKRPDTNPETITIKGAYINRNYKDDNYF